MSLDPQETFKWMTEELRRLREELDRANERILELEIDIDRLKYGHGTY